MSPESTCRLCGGETERAGGRAACRRCGAAFRTGGASSPPASVPLPRGIVAKETGDSLFIAFRWLRPAHAWPIAGAVYLSMPMVLLIGESSPNSVHWTTILFGGATYIAFGLIAAYASLAFLLNRTHVWVRNGRITVSHWPLPCHRFKRIEAADVDQVFTQADRDRHGKLVSCDVCVFRRKGRWFRLVKDLKTAEQALFVEWAIERHLGIEDEPVAGELGPKPPAP